MEEYIHQLPSKSQIAFMKLLVRVKNDLQVTKEELPDEEVLRYFLSNNKQEEETFKQISHYLEWRQQNGEIL